jgi:hypothetical protein
LAHIDTLDAAVANLDEKIEAMLDPHAKIVELLCTIPGVAVRTAQGDASFRGEAQARAAPPERSPGASSRAPGQLTPSRFAVAA